MRGVLRTLLVVVASVVAGYLVWDRVEVSRLHRDVAAIAARGEPIDLSQLDSPLPTPQHEEAARLYADAAERARAIAQQDFRLSRLDVDTVVGSVDVRELEAAYRPDAPALQLLDRATPLPFAGFGDAVDGLDWINTAGLQSLNALTALRADLFAYRGDGEAAVPALTAAIRIQRTLPDLFNRYTIGMRQFGSLRVLLRHAALTDASLEALQRAFAELPDEDGLDRDLMLRRARLIEQGDVVAPGSVSGLPAFALHPFLVHRTRVQIEQFPEAIAAARQPWPDKYASLATLAADSPSRGGPYSLRRVIAGPPLNLAALSSMPVQAGLNLAVRRVAMTTLAIERYRRALGGALPDSLAALTPAYLPAVPIDPFTGHSLVYKAASDSYVVYSVDANRIDNGGQFYGTGAMSTMALPKTRDFGIKVPLAPRPVRR